MKKVSIITLLAIAMLVACNNKKENKEAYPQYQELQKDSVPEPKDTIVQQEVVKKPEPPKPEKHPFDLQKHYFVVLNSYLIPEYANQHIDDLKKQGFEPGVFMINQDGYYRLAVESYNKFDEAEKAANKLREKGGIFSNARVMFKK